MWSNLEILDKFNRINWQTLKLNYIITFLEMIDQRILNIKVRKAMKIEVVFDLIKLYNYF